MLVQKFQKPCESGVILERLPPSWRSSMMVSISISIGTNDVWIPMVGLEEASCKACTAGFTCADTANSDRHQKGVDRFCSWAQLDDLL